MATPTNMDSGLYAPPTGIPQAAEQETAYEIEVVDPDAVSEEEAMLLASFSDEAQAEEDTGFSDNLVEQLDESTIAILASEEGALGGGHFRHEGLERCSEWLVARERGSGLVDLANGDRGAKRRGSGIGDLPTVAFEYAGM